MIDILTRQSLESWLNALKIAIVNNDQNRAVDLIEHLPDFGENIDIAISAHAMIGEFLEKLKDEKSALASQLHKLEQTKAFLES